MYLNLVPGATAEEESVFYHREQETPWIRRQNCKKYRKIDRKKARYNLQKKCKSSAEVLKNKK